MHDSRRLVLAHLWVAFGTMAIAAVLGVWQMYQRSPLAPWLAMRWPPLVVVGSWVWCALMVIAFARFKRAHPGEKVPLAMYGTVANALLWAWTSIGAAAEVLLIVLPASLGLNPSWTSALPACCSPGPCAALHRARRATALMD